MKQSSSTDNMIFFIYLASTETHLGLSLICDLWLQNKNSIQLNWNLLKLLPFCPYHFVSTILSVPFCPIPFCPVTLEGNVHGRQGLGKRVTYTCRPKKEEIIAPFKYTCTSQKQFLRVPNH